jgi:hypothetical protein
MIYVTKELIKRKSSEGIVWNASSNNACPWKWHTDIIVCKAYSTLELITDLMDEISDMAAGSIILDKTRSFIWLQPIMIFLVVTLYSIAVVSTIWEEYVASIFRVNVIMMRMRLCCTIRLLERRLLKRPEREMKHPQFLWLQWKNTYWR